MSEKQISILQKADVWVDGKIDAIKFVKLMAELNGTTEKEEMKSFLDWMGIRHNENV